MRRDKYILFILIFVLLQLTVIVLILSSGKMLEHWIRTLLPDPMSESSATLIRVGFFVLTMGCFLMMTMSRFSLFPALPRRIVQTVDVMSGYLIYILLISNALALTMALLKGTRLLPMPSDGLIRAAGIFVIASALMMTLFGIFRARHYKVTQYKLTLPQKKSTLQTFRIALISDLHIGYHTKIDQLRTMIDKIQEIQPDLLCIAGDFFDGNYQSVPEPEKIKELFRSCNIPHGTAACLGNHDAGAEFPVMLRFLQESNIRVLAEEQWHLPEKLILVGRADLTPLGAHPGVERTGFPLLNNIEQDLPVIVLDHQPTTIPEYDSEADLLLMGHTHKGQLFPFGWITKALYRADHGYYHENASKPQVIIACGAGTWGPPMKTSGFAEIVSIDLHFQ